MSNVDDILDGFRAQTEAEKQETFEVSTSCLILQQLGLTAAHVRELRTRYDAAFGIEWVNDVFDRCTTKTERFFNYNLTELLEPKLKHPVLAGFREKMDEFAQTGDSTQDRLMVVFKASGVGRLVASNLPFPERTHLCIHVEPVHLYLTTFTKLYTDLYGPALEGVPLE